MSGALAEWLRDGGGRIGQIVIAESGRGGFSLRHRDDLERSDLQKYSDAEEAAELAKWDDAGDYRPLKTAPNLRHGWQLDLPDDPAMRLALDLFYPARLGAFLAWREEALAVTPLRATLAQQSGMYRVANKITDAQIDELVGGFCRSDGGCLRTILWPRDETNAVASSRLPPEKFDPKHDQGGRGERAIPLLCQEACNLLVAAARKVVKGE